MAKYFYIMILTLTLIYINHASPFSRFSVSEKDLEEVLVQHSDDNDETDPLETLYATDIFDDASDQEDYVTSEEEEFDQSKAAAESIDVNEDNAAIMSQKSNLKTIKKKEKKLKKLIKKTKQMNKDAKLLLKKAHYNTKAAKAKENPARVKMNAAMKKNNSKQKKKNAVRGEKHKKHINKAADKILKKIEQLDKEGQARKKTNP